MVSYFASKLVNIRKILFGLSWACLWTTVTLQARLIDKTKYFYKVNINLEIIEYSEFVLTKINNFLIF